MASTILYRTAGGPAEQAGGTQVASALTHQQLDNNFYTLTVTTKGTVEESKAVIVDASKNIATLGTVGCGAITSTGTSGFANITASGTLVVTGLTTTGDLTLSAADPEILGGDTNGTLYIAPSTTNALGGNILLYGDTHATKANDIEFRATAGVEAHYDDSGSLWDFQANAITTTGTITGDLTGNVTGNVTGTVTATSSLADGVTATSQLGSDDSTKVATTEFVQDAIAAIAALPVDIIAFGVMDGSGTPSYTFQSGMNASITDNGVGNYSLAFDANEPDTNFGVLIMTMDTGVSVPQSHVDNVAVGGFDIIVFEDTGAGLTSTFDPTAIAFFVFRSI